MLSTQTEYPPAACSPKQSEVPSQIRYRNLMVKECGVRAQTPSVDLPDVPRSARWGWPWGFAALSAVDGAYFWHVSRHQTPAVPRPQTLSLDPPDVPRSARWCSLWG